MNLHGEIIIGHMRLNVANLERSLVFYCGLIGLQKGEQDGNLITLCPGSHHHIVLEPPHRTGAHGAPYGHTGMYHFSFLYPERKELGRIVKKLVGTAHEIDGVIDYGISQAVYLRDPDGIPVELYVEDPLDKVTRRSERKLAITPKSIDLESLLENL